MSARRTACQQLPVFARVSEQPHLLGWSEARSCVRIELLASRYAQKHVVHRCRHLVLALRRPRACRRRAKHRSGRGAEMMSDGAAGNPQHPRRLPSEAAGQDLPSIGQILLQLLHARRSAAQLWQVIPLPSSNATSSRHRKCTNTYSVTCWVYWYTCERTARQPPSVIRE